MEELEIYKAVTRADTLEDLQNVIIALTDSEGLIQGRTRKFNASQMSHNMAKFINDESCTILPNVITREYGLRQQAMYIKFYQLGVV